MKKWIVLFIVSLIATALWWNKGYILYAHRYWKTTPDSAFAHHKTANVDIGYTAGTPVAQNLAKLTSELENNLKEAEQRLSYKLQSPLKAFIYNTFEEKGAHVRSIELAQADLDEKTIHFIWNSTFNGLAERIEYQILLHEKYGDASDEQWSRAATAALADRWNHKNLEDWQRFLEKRKLIPIKLNEPRVSEFISTPYAAIVAKNILNTQGFDAFVKLYKDGEVPEQYQPNQIETRVVHATNRRHQFEPVFQKGMTYAYWNSVDGGYAGSKSKRSLQLLKKSGVEWIAAIPYGFMQDHDDPLMRNAGHHIHSENDESLFQLALDARQLGIKIMMKPQIWISHEAWPGKVNMNNNADWNLWFENYEYWIVHYAVIAELMGADSFCIGTELVQTTLQHPQQWRNIIAKVREVYSGPIVYAANWGKEFEEITFWDALDYIGLDNYYPVRESTKDGIEVIRAGFAEQKKKLAAIANRWQKPILFTEIGYMANEGAGMGSQESNYSRYDEKAQAECYKAAMETYWNEPWFAGMYWWKWFSNPDDQGRNADEHSPHGRLAGKIIAEQYARPRLTEPH